MDASKLLRAELVRGCASLPVAVTPLDALVRRSALLVPLVELCVAGDAECVLDDNAIASATDGSGASG